MLHHIAEHPDVVVQTQGRMRDIGCGVTHKTWIVELSLQMHSETAIVERTQHAYENVKAYLREFVRVMTLDDVLNDKEGSRLRSRTEDPIA